MLKAITNENTMVENQWQKLKAEKQQCSETKKAIQVKLKESKSIKHNATSTPNNFKVNRKKTLTKCKDNGYGEYAKETTTSSGWKFQLKTIRGSSMNDEETLTPLDRLQLATKQHYTLVQRNSYPYIILQHKSKLKVKTKQNVHRLEIPDLRPK